VKSFDFNESPRTKKPFYGCLYMYTRRKQRPNFASWSHGADADDFGAGAERRRGRRAPTATATAAGRSAPAVGVRTCRFVSRRDCLLRRHGGARPPLGRGEASSTLVSVTPPPAKIGVVSNSRRWVFPRPETVSWCPVRAGSRLLAPCPGMYVCWRACACACASVYPPLPLHSCACACVCPPLPLQAGTRARVPACNLSGPFRADKWAGVWGKQTATDCKRLLETARFGRSIIAANVCLAVPSGWLS
jgi:hypothetical protein